MLLKTRYMHSLLIHIYVSDIFPSNETVFSEKHIIDFDCNPIYSYKPLQRDNDSQFILPAIDKSIRNWMNDGEDGRTNRNNSKWKIDEWFVLIMGGYKSGRKK